MSSLCGSIVTQGIKRGKHQNQKKKKPQESKASANLVPSSFSLHSHTKDAKSALYTASDNRPPAGKRGSGIRTCEILKDELSCFSVSLRRKKKQQHLSYFKSSTAFLYLSIYTQCEVKWREAKIVCIYVGTHLQLCVKSLHWIQYRWNFKCLNTEIGGAMYLQCEWM